MKRIPLILVTVLAGFLVKACIDRPTGPPISFGKWEDFPEFGLVGFTDLIYLNVVGTTMGEENDTLPGAVVYLYNNEEYGDTLKTTSDTDGNFAFGALACRWKLDDLLSETGVYIKAEIRSDSLSYLAAPRPVACKSDTQHVVLVLERLVD